MADEGFKRKLAAILSADVEGYSRLMDDDEEATVRTLTAYRTAITDLVQQFRGRVVDSTGDNLLAEFTSVVDAVNCAVEIQRDIAERNAELPYNRKMEFRIGVNLGDVIEEEGRIYGDGVNISARVEGLAEAGGICISGRAYDQVENKLGLEYENLGEHSVKNITRPIRVYRVLSYPGAAAHRVVQAKEALGRKWSRIALSIAAVAVVVAVVFGIWQFYMRRPSVEPASVHKMAYPLPEKPSIAVLPFDNLSGDPKQEYIADGISENIITTLSKIPKLFVIARNSTFTYKGKPVKIQKVSEDLGVRYVLEGSVQKSGERIRITAQLIDAIKGHHLWSERYDRDLKNLFDLQDDITRNVIMALQVKLTEGDSARIWGKGTANLEAYLKVMKGLRIGRRFTKDDIEAARQLYGEAIVLDPNYARAYVLLAECYRVEANYGWTKTPIKSNEKAIELAKKAISLDELNANAYMVFANVYAMAGQFEKAMAAAKKGISLAPSNSVIYAHYGLALYYSGRFKEAIPIFEKAIRIDPIHPGWYSFGLGASYFFIGQNEEAITILKKLVSRETSYADAHYLFGGALIAGGKPEEAVAMLDKALSLNPDRPGSYVGNLAVARLGAGQPEEAITTLREVLSRDPENGEVCLWLSVVLTSEGKYEEALSVAKEAVSLKERGLKSASPAANFYWWLGTPYHMMGQYEEAIAAYKKAISFWPDYMFGHIGLTASYSLAGRMEEARAEAAEVLRINPKISLESIAKSGYYNFKKTDKERFINALRKAGLK